MLYDQLNCLPSLENPVFLTDCCESVIDSTMMKPFVNITYKQFCMWWLCGNNIRFFIPNWSELLLNLPWHLIIWFSSKNSPNWSTQRGFGALSDCKYFISAWKLPCWIALIQCLSADLISSTKDWVLWTELSLLPLQRLIN